MGIISNYDFEWHEKTLMIFLLWQKPLPRDELYKRLRRTQKEKETPIGKFKPHSTRNYNYWLNHLKARRILKEEGKTLELTALGKWVANSKLGTDFERERFTSLVCPECSSPSETAEPLDIVLLRPLLGTREVNAKGHLFMDFECPRCRTIHTKWNVSGIAKESSFVGFYNQAIKELKHISGIKVHGHEV